ncbi:DUF6438 domain-containing protein [Dyella japonica]|uniref:DUF6438 domain-containing protein n=1 Tax=Dyella japonica TaxID=231455 RepID=A0ABV2JVH7_9GAMM
MKKPYAQCFLKGALLSSLLLAASPLSAAENGAEEVTVALERSACFGSCQAYSVTIHRDGYVLFTTDISPIDEVDTLHKQFAASDGVLLPGTHEDDIDPKEVAVLVKQFEAADFWRLKSEYRSDVHDAPTQVITLTLGDRKKVVLDYMGTRAGMPRAVEDLEIAVDRTAGTDRWIKGSPGLIPWLERTKFDFHSVHAGELVVAAEMGEADEATVMALIDHDAPLDQTINIPGSYPSQPEMAGVTLIEHAIRRGHADVFKRLSKGGWLDRLGRTEASQIFAEYAAGCSPALVHAAAESGVDIDTAAFRKTDADTESQGKTALANLGSQHVCSHDENARVLTAKALLDRGADPNHRDSLGKTPLYGVENLDLLNTLLAHGADASAKSNDGRSMVFGSWNDAVVLRLLEAGASPAGQYDFGGKTLAQQAKAGGMPMVTRWLVAHPEAYER